jgi:pimeloyl-ACP methyl ester carboxylesterase
VMDRRPPVRYAKAGDVSIAYRVLGEGPLDLVWVPGLASNLEMEWEQPVWFGFMQRLASFSRLIAFDKRGMGLSDRNVGAPTLEERMDDVRAVMDAAGSERAALLALASCSSVPPADVPICAPLRQPARSVLCERYGVSLTGSYL